MLRSLSPPMKATLVQVPAEAFRSRLAGAGFRLREGDPLPEEVYDRVHDRDPRYAVRVFSTVQRGEAGTRERGVDAVRVVAVFTPNPNAERPTSLPIFTGARVHRSGTVERVLDRVIERAREAYAEIDKHRLMAAVTEYAFDAAARLNRDLRKRRA